jgi:hypothetical protein
MDQCVAITVGEFHKVVAERLAVVLECELVACVVGGLVGGGDEQRNGRCQDGCCEGAKGQ